MPKLPRGFPRGSLLCVNSHKEQVRAYKASTLLKWIEKADKD